jgi:hypothetical protein
MYLKLKRVGEITARTKQGLFQICIFLYNFDIHVTNFNELNLLILILEEISLFIHFLTFLFNSSLSKLSGLLQNLGETEWESVKLISEGSQEVDPKDPNGSRSTDKT